MHAELVFRPLVKQELEKIIGYYEEQKTGLGLLFLDVLDLLLTRVQKNPLHFQVRHKNIRRAGLEGFPYNVYFRLYKNQIIILAILHQKRNPRFWKTAK